jgi:peptidoglycan/xylan/chitin deacetylase (PgdA/CDA1 family)/glycosyltransferase involved in cell wall biosynthesis/CelD/BcsL family acetyltransferase involved in cellulose biosynthesis
MRILVCSAALPLAPLDGLGLQVAALCRELARRHEVCVVGYCWPEQAGEPMAPVETVAVPAPSRDPLPRIAGWARAAVSGEPVETVRMGGLSREVRRLLDERQFDVVHVAGPTLAGLGPILADRRALIAPLDAWHLNLQASILTATGLRRSLLVLHERRIRRYTATAYRPFRRVVMVSDADARAAAELDPALRLAVVPNGVDVDAFAPRPEVEREPGLLVFTGALHAPANELAAHTLVHQVLPRVRERRPEARVAIVGRRPPETVRALADLPGVTVAADVPDVREWLWRAEIFTCPMLSGTGIKNKLLEALACGTPTVATPLACQGMTVADGSELLVADDATLFADAVVRLLEDPALRDQIARQGRRHAIERHSWESVGHAFERLYDEIMREEPGAPAVTVPAAPERRSRNPIARRPRPAHDVVVLCYHAVSERWPSAIAVTPGALERQTRTMLELGYAPATFHEAVAAPPAAKTFAVTFDDGYRSTLEHGLPVLERLGVPATVFLPTAFIDAGRPLVWPGNARWRGGRFDAELDPLSWDEVRRLVAAGWEIGSHTRSHPNLAALGDDELENELTESRARCEAMTQTPCLTLAYPFGRASERVKERTRAAGYECAAAVPVRLHGPDPFAWPRIGIGRGLTPAGFRRLVSPRVRALRATPAGPSLERSYQIARGRGGAGRLGIAAPEGWVDPPGLRVSPIADLDAEREEWARLALRSGNVFATWEWAATWWRHHGGGRELQLHGVYDHRGGLVGVVPAYAALPAVARLIGHPQADRSAPVCAPEDRPQVAAAIERGLESGSLRFELLLADALPRDEGWEDRLPGAALGAQPSPALPIRWSTWDEYLASRSRHQRSHLRNRERRLLVDHGLRVRLADDPDRIADDLDHLFRLHRARWQGQEESPFAADERFHRDFAAVAFERGWLRLWMLEGRDGPIAAWYGFRFGGVDAFYQTGRDPAWAHESVGTFLIAHSIRDAIESGAEEYRFLRGGDDYKRRFGAEDGAVVRYAAGASTTGQALARTARLAQEVRGQVTRRAASAIASRSLLRSS